MSDRKLLLTSFFTHGPATKDVLGDVMNWNLWHAAG